MPAAAGTDRPSLATLSGPAHVVDGDTVDVAGHRIRIQGIDAPELAETCRRHSGAEWACGQWAKFETVRLFQGRVLDCIDLGERTHGRVVAQCFHEGEDIALALIDRGIAQACEHFARQHPHSMGYMDAEKAAAIAGRGIFAGPTNPRAGFCIYAPEATPARVSHPELGDCAIKGNVSANGRIYHMPGQAHYDRINMDKPGTRFFCTEEDAVEAGWRPARR